MKSEVGDEYGFHIRYDEDGMETEYRDATEEEIAAYLPGIDRIPMAVWIVALVGAAERFSFYATTVPWQNYMQNKPGTAVPGALGFGQSRATIIYNAFNFVSYLTPMPMAVLADTWIGRYRTVLLGLFLYTCGLTILFATSFETALRSGVGLPGFITALILISFGVGGVKSAVVPYIIDQYPRTAPKLIKQRGKTPFIGDRTLTIQYIYNVYYWFVNIAGLSSLATTFLEKNYGFWAAFLLPFCTIWIPIFLLLFFQKRFINIPPQGNILPKAVKTLAAAARGGFKFSSATPEYQLKHYGKTVSWDTTFVLEMHRGLIACRVIACFILFQLCYDQIQNNLISQAGQMRLGRVPNDAIQVLNPVIYILLGPVIQKILYPFLARRKIAFLPIARITVAFIIMAMAMGYASGTQGLIYSRGPCYDHPSTCPGSNGGKIPNDITVWAQAPIYFILAVAEAFGFVTGTEYAYSKAPQGMKTVVQALWQLAAAFGGALGMALSPLAKDPHLVALYAALAGTMLVASVAFWVLFKKYDKIDEELNRFLETGN